MPTVRGRTGTGTGRLRPYPAYKDSGVPWLGKVPEHWRLQPGKACFQLMQTPNIGQFSDDESFRRWLTDTIFGLTYEQTEEQSRTTGRTEKSLGAARKRSRNDNRTQ